MRKLLFGSVSPLAYESKLQSRVVNDMKPYAEGERILRNTAKFVSAVDFDAQGMRKSDNKLVAAELNLVDITITSNTSEVIIQDPIPPVPPCPPCSPCCCCCCRCCCRCCRCCRCCCCRRCCRCGCRCEDNRSC